MSKRRSREAETSRTVQIGRETWRIRRGERGENSEELLPGRAHVCVDSPDGRRHWLIMVDQELEQSSRYRLRCLVLGLRDRPREQVTGD